MRAIYYLSILTNDFICILDRNMRVFPHDVMAAQGLRGQVTDTWISIAPLTYDEESKCVTIRVVHLGSGGVGHVRRKLSPIKGVNWNFDTD